MRFLSLLLLLAACSHDTSRENPLDPDLTPAVALAVVVDDTTGTATLTWSAYGGAAPFSHYLVLRQISDRVGVDTLASIADAGSAAYTDSTVVHGTAYTYRVSVVNEEGLEMPSGEQRVHAVGLPAVRMRAADFHSPSASANVEWTAYAGPRFAAYELWRSTPDGSVLVARIDDLQQTSFSDSGLVGNTPYSYQVVVTTTLDEELSSDEISGSIHGLVDTWEIDGDPQGIFLSHEPDRRVGALVIEWLRNEIEVIVFDAEGTLHQRFDPFEVVPISVSTTGFSLSSLNAGSGPWTIRMAIDDEGRRFLNLGGLGPVLFGFEPDGSPIERTYELFAEDFDTPLVGDEAIVLGEIRLRGRDLTIGAFDNAVVSEDGETVFSEDFSDFPEGELVAGVVGDWELLGPHRSETGRIQPRTADGARVVNDTWQDFRLEADVFNRVDGPGIQIGGDTYSSFYLHINKDRASTATLEWTFTPPSGSDLPSRHKTFVHELPIDFPASEGGPPAGSRLGLEMVDGRLRVSITQRVFWHSADFQANWASMAFVDGVLVTTAQERAFTVTPDGDGTRRQDLDSGVSETRTWIDGRGQTWAGICLPALGQLRIGIIRNASSWDRFLTTKIGPFIGNGGLQLHVPMSFDVGPDGRIYVLDAGSGVVVLDEEGQFITSWEVEPIVRLSTGEVPDRAEVLLAGSSSILVDDDGFVYVADPVNARIQKFAP